MPGGVAQLLSSGGYATLYNEPSAEPAFMGNHRVSAGLKWESLKEGHVCHAGWSTLWRGL